MENGPPASLPPKLRAEAVLNAGSTMGNALNQELRRNDELIGEAKDIVSLQEGQKTWPTILHLINSALPAPDEGLAELEGWVTSLPASASVGVDLDHETAIAYRIDSHPDFSLIGAGGQLLCADVERNYVQAFERIVDGDALALMNTAFEEMTAEALASATEHGYDPSIVDISRFGDFRYRRQSSDLTIPIASKELEQEQGPWLFGEHTYWLACMAAVGEDSQRALKLLREAFAQRHSLFRVTLEHGDFYVHCDMNFETLRDDPAFQELIRPKG